MIRKKGSIPAFLFRTQDELIRSFVDHIELELSEMEKNRKFYQWNRLTKKEYADIAQKVLKTVSQKYVESLLEEWEKNYLQLAKKTLTRITQKYMKSASKDWNKNYLKLAKEALIKNKQNYLDLLSKNWDKSLKTIKTRTRVRVKP